MIKCSVTGIPTAIKDLILFKRSLPEKARQMIEKLGQAGYEVASAKFSTAIYAGLNDVIVTLNWENDTLADTKATPVMRVRSYNRVHTRDGLRHMVIHPQEPCMMRAKNQGTRLRKL